MPYQYLPDNNLYLSVYIFFLRRRRLEKKNQHF